MLLATFSNFFYLKKQQKATFQKIGATFRNFFFSRIFLGSQEVSFGCHKKIYKNLIFIIKLKHSFFNYVISSLSELGLLNELLSDSSFCSSEITFSASFTFNTFEFERKFWWQFSITD